MDGVEGCQVKFARCCNPLPGDRVIGFITKGYGISVHNVDCPNVANNIDKEEYRDRWVKAYWENGAAAAQDNSFEALIVVYAQSGITLLADITTALADMKVSLTNINMQKKPADRLVINLTVTCKNLDHAKSIVSRLKAVSGVESVTRGMGQQ